MRKRIVSLLITSAFILSLFSGAIIFADNAALETAISNAKSEMYGMYTPQSAAYMRDCYNKAVAAKEDNGEAAALNAAVENLVPLETFNSTPLAGFSSVTQENLDAMKYSTGTLSVNKGTITVSGATELRYSNAADTGIVGDSPFQLETTLCDGFTLHIAPNAPATLDIAVGIRGSQNDCVYTIYDAVIKGEGDYLFPFADFGEDIPLDGSLNYISLSFHGATEVSFGNFNAITASETAVELEYSSKKLKAPEFDSNKYYKIFPKGQQLAFTMVDDDEHGHYQLLPAEDGNEAQEWQICRDKTNSNRFRIINRYFGTCVYANVKGSSPSLEDICPDLTDENQEWAIAYSSKGFSIYITNKARLAYADTRVRCSTYSVTAKYFDIYEINTNENWSLVWSEEFNQDSLDYSSWRHRTGFFRSEGEPIYHTDRPENIYMEDGSVVFKAIKEDYEGYPVTGAYIDTVGKHMFTYGRIEARAKLPSGAHVWPACWMMGTSTLGYASCGELDIVEMVGSGEDDNHKGNHSTIATVHCELDDDNNYTQGSNPKGCMLTENDLSEDYHLYSVEWDATSIKWFWDDVLFFSMPIDTNQEKYSFLRNPMYIILNISISAFGTERDRIISEFPDEATYHVDYIHYFKKSCESLPQSDTPAVDVDSFAFQSPSFEIENAFTKDNTGEKIIVSGQSRAINIFDFNGNEILVKDKQFEEATSSAVVSPDGTKWVFLEQYGTCYLYNSDLSTRIKLENIHDIAGGQCAITPDSKYLVVFGRPQSSKDRNFAKYVRVFDLDTGEQVMEDPYTTFGRYLKMANDGKFAVSGTDGKARLYGTDFKLIAELENEQVVTAMAFTSDSSKIVTSNTVGVIRIWDAQTGELLKTIDGIGTYDILSLSISPDGKTIAAGCNDFSVRVFDMLTGKMKFRLTGANETIKQVEYSPDGTLLAASSADRYIRLYDTDGILKCRLYCSEEDSGYFDRFLFSNDGKTIAGEVFKGQEDNIAFWHIPDGLAAESKDTSAIDELMSYVDEYSYTPESYEVYADAMAAAKAAKQNKYLSDDEITAAASALSDAIKGLSEASKVTKGDFDNDGEITVADALAALRIAAKLVPEDTVSIEIGDIDADNHVTVADALAILRVAAKLTDTL